MDRQICFLGMLLVLGACSSIPKKSRCERLVADLQANPGVRVESGNSQIISTDPSKWDSRTDTAGRHFMFERSKSDLLQRLYRSQSSINIKVTDTKTTGKGQETLNSKTSEDIELVSKNMVTIVCNNTVYAFVNEGEFK